MMFEIGKIDKGELGMDFTHLQTFRVLVEELSFTRTALRMNYAQSTVTGQIQGLERVLGVPLFNRLGRNLQLTEPGIRLLHYTDEILRLVDEAYSEVPGTQHPSGPLIVGTVESLCAYRLSPILQEFRSRYPQVRLIFRTGVSADLREQTRKGALDLALILDSPTQDEALTIERLRTEPMLILVNRAHRLATNGKAKPTDLEGETLLAPEPGSYRNLFERYLVESGVRRTTTIEFSSVEAIKQCVIAGIGITLLPEMTASREVGSGELVGLVWDGPSFPIETQVCWNKKRWQSPASSAFIEIVREWIV